MDYPRSTQISTQLLGENQLSLNTLRNFELNGSKFGKPLHQYSQQIGEKIFMNKTMINEPSKFINTSPSNQSKLLGYSMIEKKKSLDLYYPLYPHTSSKSNVNEDIKNFGIGVQKGTMNTLNKTPKNHQKQSTITFNIKQRPADATNNLHLRYPSTQYVNMGLMNPNNKELYTERIFDHMPPSTMIDTIKS